MRGWVTLLGVVATVASGLLYVAQKRPWEGGMFVMCVAILAAICVARFMERPRHV